MVSILDIAPAAVKGNTVTVRGQPLEVSGLSLAHIAFLVKKFPEVRKMFSGSDVSFSYDDLFDKVPGLLYDIIVCSTGGIASYEKAVGIAKKLTVEEQVAILDATFTETFKDGVGPFVERVKHLFGLASDAGSKALASN